MRLLSRCSSTALVCSLALAFAAGACSSQESAPPSSEAPAATTSTASPRPTTRVTSSSTPIPTPTPSATLPPLQRLDQVALSATDLPAGFTVTASGPGGPELGPDVLASYQEEFQQRDVTSAQSLQQTIVIISLLGQYKDAASALSGIRSINVQTLNQLLGSVSLNAEAASVPPIGEDSQAFHFTGDSNNVSVGGYLIVFHRGAVAALILTAAVKGSESLQQTVDLAQKQDQKLAAPR